MEFDLSQALDGSPTFDDETFQLSCYDMTDVEDKTYPLDKGLDLVISYNRKTMQRVANLVVAVNRMKKSLKNCGRGLSNEQLCSEILESLVEETTIDTVEQPSRQKIYTRVNSVKHCTITDSSKKDVVHGPEEMELQAITLKGGSCERKVEFTLLRYVTPEPQPGKGQPVVLSIRNTGIHISCSMTGNRAVLKLERCLEEHLERISDEQNMDRFLFYHTVTGLDETKFESVRCPSWYISTSCKDENMLLEMCEVDNVGRLKSFMIN
ncbi:interleukin-1 beta [Sphaeramia orbicularis]|uniref:Interleukin-1 n=1 Tax=Sphaeramia orbicularis TaxID=375764 RepID=A0A672Z3V3_9TELE|nr:interleukin-1 beta-like [Sphaeramia orbicularis]